MESDSGQKNQGLFSGLARFFGGRRRVTEAERYKNALVFRPPLAEFRWLEDSTANWRFPNGCEMGGIEQKMDHPVTTISYTDALAYCAWAKVRLPTLDEWEVASRAGSSTHYWWGNGHSQLHTYANIWQGRNHTAFAADDPYPYTSPVGSFKPNPWGLHDMYGNVFEFCSGLPPAFAPLKGVGCARGGSWWCSRNSCNYFNSADIGKANVHASFSNQGFRVARDAQ